MMTSDEIEAEFRDRAVAHGGNLILLIPEDAIALVKRCHREGVKILGIDAFRVAKGTTQPLMEYSIDFSLNEKTLPGRGYWQEAEALLRKNASLGLVFEVTLA